MPTAVTEISFDFSWLAAEVSSFSISSSSVLISVAAAICCFFSSSSLLYGIFQGTARGTKLFQNNTVYNLSGPGGVTMYGLYVGYGTTVDMSGNTIYGLSCTGGTSSSMYCIKIGSTAITVNIYNNKFYDI